jgi:hypothetical protein
VVEIGLRPSNRSLLLESWIKKKIRRDKMQPLRVAAAEHLDIEDFTARVIRVMELVAGRMVDPATHELLEFIESQDVVEIASQELRDVDLLGLVLHSLLLPVRSREGSSLPLAFAFRVVQEYLLARYLVRQGKDDALYPASVREFVQEITK